MDLDGLSLGVGDVLERAEPKSAVVIGEWELQGSKRKRNVVSQLSGSGAWDGRLRENEDGLGRMKQGETRQLT